MGHLGGPAFPPELAELHCRGKRSDRFAVAMPAEQHGEVGAGVALLQVVHSGSGRSFAGVRRTELRASAVLPDDRLPLRHANE